MQAILDWIGEHPGVSGALFAASIATFFGSLLLLPFLVARLPADYFVEAKATRPKWRALPPLVVGALYVVKNALGVVLFVAGIAMLFLPGQGLLTLFAALVLLDFPGKRALERSLVARPRVLGALNWVRRRSGNEPLLPPR